MLRPTKSEKQPALSSGWIPNVCVYFHLWQIPQACTDESRLQELQNAAPSHGPCISDSNLKIRHRILRAITGLMLWFRNNPTPEVESQQQSQRSYWELKVVALLATPLLGLCLCADVCVCAAVCACVWTLQSGASSSRMPSPSLRLGLSA